MSRFFVGCPCPAPPHPGHWLQRVTQGRESQPSPHSNGKMSAIYNRAMYYKLSKLIEQAEADGPQETRESAKGISSVLLIISWQRQMVSSDVGCPEFYENYPSLLFFVCISQQLYDLEACSHTPGPGTSHSCSCLVRNRRYCSISHHIIHIN